MSYGSVMGQAQDISKIEQDIVNLQNDYVPKSGATMTGELNMGNNKISGVANGVEVNDVATIGQLDSAGWYPFKGSGLTLLIHSQGYFDSKNLKKTFYLDEKPSALYVSVSLCLEQSRASSFMNNGRVAFNSILPIYGGSGTSLKEVGSVTIPSSVEKSVRIEVDSPGYYDLYIFKP